MPVRLAVPTCNDSLLVTLIAGDADRDDNWDGIISGWGNWIAARIIIFMEQEKNYITVKCEI